MEKQSAIAQLKMFANGEEPDMALLHRATQSLPMSHNRSVVMLAIARKVDKIKTSPAQQIDVDRALAELIGFAPKTAPGQTRAELKARLTELGIKFHSNAKTPWLVVEVAAAEQAIEAEINAETDAAAHEDEPTGDPANVS